MQTLKVLGIVFLWSMTFGVSYAAETDARKLCKEEFEKYTFVNGLSVGRKDSCIPADPCSSSDSNVRDLYCIKSIDDIDLRLEKSLDVALGANGTSCAVSIMGSGSQATISDCLHVGLKPGEWLARFPYGTVKGESICSAEGIGFSEFEYSAANKRIWVYDDTKLNSAQGEKQYCWCKVNGLYTLMTDTTPKAKFLKVPWMFSGVSGDRNCPMTCALDCAASTSNIASKSAMFFGKEYQIPISNETEAKKFCKENLDKYSYVVEKDICISENACSSSDTSVRNAYCIKSINDIDLRIDGTHTRAHIITIPLGRKEHTYNTCKISLIGSSATWFSSDCTSVGLKPSEWLVRFPYGTVKGKSMCSAQSGGVSNSDYGPNSKKIWTNNEQMLKTAQGEKQYCWCKADGLYTLMTDTKPKESFNQPVWVYVFDERYVEYCEEFCTEYCANEVAKTPNARSAMFFGK